MLLFGESSAQTCVTCAQVQLSEYGEAVTPRGVSAPIEQPTGHMDSV
jgi:hypothetical protein